MTIKRAKCEPTPNCFFEMKLILLLRRTHDPSQDLASRLRVATPSFRLFAIFFAREVFDGSGFRSPLWVQSEEVGARQANSELEVQFACCHAH